MTKNNCMPNFHFQFYTTHRLREREKYRSTEADTLQNCNQLCIITMWGVCAIEKFPSIIPAPRVPY